MERQAPCRCERLPINGLTYHVRHWGPDDAPLLLMLHGWMDSSASFQFTVDALQRSWHVLAPDWRGYGQSEWLNRRYWFADYYADLDYAARPLQPRRARRASSATAWAARSPASTAAPGPNGLPVC
jgi:pimeloyl-ACP methyl ester carboxylesterase